MKPKMSLFLSILLLILASLSLLKMKVDNSPDTYIPPYISEYNKKVREIYDQEDDVFLLYFKVKDSLSKDFLRKLKLATEEIKQISGVKKTYSIFDSEHTFGAEDSIVVEKIVEIENLDELSLEKIKEKILKSKATRGLLYSENLKGFAIIVEPSSSKLHSFERIEMDKQITKVIEEVDLKDFLAAEAGLMKTDVEQFYSMKDDMMEIIPLTSVLAMIMLLLQFPNIIVFIVSILSLNLGSSIALSTFVVFGWPFNLVSSMIPSLIISLVVALLLHLYSTITYFMSRGESYYEAIDKSLEDIRKPCFYSILTTAIGLFSLSLSDIPPIRQFGVTSSIGAMSAYFICLHLAPGMMKLFKPKSWKSGKAAKGIQDKIIDAFITVGVRQRKLVLILVPLLMILLIPFIFSIKSESNLLKFFRDSHTIVKANNLVQTEMQGTNTLDFVLKYKDGSEVTSLEFLNSVKKLQVFAESLPEVDNSLSVVNFVEDMYFAFSAEKEGTRLIPDNQEMIDQLLLIYDGDDLYNVLTRSMDESRVNFSVNVHGAREGKALVEKLEKYLTSNLSSNIEFRSAGFIKLFSDQNDLLVNGQLKSLAGSMLVIFFFMMLLWRSFFKSVVCMIPNMTPIVFIFILMGVLNIWLDMGTSMIASVAIGIAVDDTIHIFYGFYSRLKKGNTALWALIETYHTAGRAVLGTTVILTCQFSVLMLSNFVPTAHFGALMSTALVTALFFDLILLPALLLTVATSQKLSFILK